MPQFFFIPVHGVTQRPGPGAQIRGGLAWTWNDVTQRGSFAGNIAAPAAVGGGARVRGMGSYGASISIEEAFATSAAKERSPLEPDDPAYIMPEILPMQLTPDSPVPIAPATPTTKAGAAPLDGEERFAASVQRLESILYAQDPAPKPEPVAVPVVAPPAPKKANGLVWLGLIAAGVYAFTR